jgi:hypothetical protein
VVLKKDGSVVATTATDDAGAYEFFVDDLGTYTVEVTTPFAWYQTPWPETVAVTESTDYTVDFDYEAAGKLSGKLTDSEGAGIEGLSVIVRDEEGRERVAVTDEHGSYSLYLAPQDSEEPYICVYPHLAWRRMRPYLKPLVDVETPMCFEYQEIGPAGLIPLRNASA